MKKILIRISLLAALLFIANSASAAIWDSVGCSGTDCQMCHLVSLANLVMDFLLFYIAMPLAAISFAIAGFMLMFAKGNESKVTQAKKIFWSVLWGLIIALAAFLVVDSILKSLLTSASYGVWNEVQCVAMPATGAVSPTAAAELTVNCPADCGPIPPQIPAKNVGIGCSPTMLPAPGTRCYLDDDLNTNLINLRAILAATGPGYGDSDWWVTEAWPPTVNHANSCHAEGSCIDLNFQPSFTVTPAAVKDFVQAITNASGLTGIYEVKTVAEKTALEAAGVPSANIDVVPWITGPHFSVYCPSCY